MTTAASKSPRRLRFCLTSVFLLLCCAPAGAQRLVISDLSNVSEEAAALNLLIRSMLAGGKRPAVPRVELQLALDRVSPGKRSLIVGISEAPELLKGVQADRLLTAELAREGTQLSVTFHAYDLGMAPLGAGTVTGHVGDLSDIAAELTRRAAEALGCDVQPRVEASPGELRPFARAAALLSQGSPSEAAQALAVANATVSAKVSAAKEIADALWRNPSLPASLRSIAALAAGEAKSALEIVDGAPGDVEARAQGVRAKLATEDLAGAERDLAALRGKKGSAALELARAELALKQGKKPREVDKHLIPLLKSGDPSALAFVARLPPKALSPEAETLALSGARRLPKEQAEVASSIGQRAARGGNASGVAVGLIDAQGLSSSELNMLDMDDLLAASPEGQKVLEEIKGRGAGAAAAAQLGRVGNGGLGAALGSKAGAKGGGAAPKAAAKRAGGASALPTSAAQQVEIIDPAAVEVADLLVPILETFAALSERRSGTVVVVPASGNGDSSWSPFLANTTLLRIALKRALSSAPYGFGVVEAPPNRVLSGLNPAELKILARQTKPPADFVLVYRFGAADGTDATASISLYDVASEDAFEQTGTVPGGRTKIVRVNPLLLVGGLSALLALAAVLVLWILRLLRAGEVIVEIIRDTGSERDNVSLIFTRSEKAPEIVDAGAWDQLQQGRGPRRTRLEHNLCNVRESFPRVPVGTWYLHLVGVQVKGGELRVATPLTQKVVVQTNGTHHVKLDQDPQGAEIKVRVVDGDPIPGAQIYLDEASAQAVLTGADGEAVLTVPLGQHVLHVNAKGLEMTRELDVISSKVQVLTFDLVREQQLAKLSEGIAIEGMEERPASAPAAAPVELGSQPAPALSDPDDDFISLPAGFAAPALDAAALFAAPPAVGATVRGVPGSSAPAGMAAAGVSPRAAGLPPSGLVAAGMPSVGVVTAQGMPTAARYQRLAELGRGAMGVVYRARDLVLEREVALKIVSEEVRKHPGALEMFLQEAKAMAALNHPNLVTVFDQGQLGEETFMVMELIEGRTLEQLIAAERKLPLARALDLADQLCAGLSYAHARRIVHRDIKPANVFVSNEDVVKVGDFGLARIIRQVRLSQTKVCGTPLYMSPEQIRGVDVDFRADLYSVGCTLFEVLTGSPPFTTGEVMYHHMYTEPPKPSESEPSLPPEVDALVLSCLVKEKERRVASADDLRAAIRPIRARLG